MCSGKVFARLEILVFLHNLVDRFGWELVNPNEKWMYDPSINPVNGLPVRLRSPVCPVRYMGNETDRGRGIILA